MDVFEINGRRFHITKHAQERILDMQLEPGEVRAVLAHPEKTTASRAYPGTHNWDMGRVTLCVRQDTDGITHVVTALWSSDELWQADLLLRECAGDRVYKPGMAPIRNYS